MYTQQYKLHAEYASSKEAIPYYTHPPMHQTTHPLTIESQG